MSYVDGFMAAVPEKSKTAYREMAAKAAAIFRKHGALRVVECWGDDVPDGKLTSMPMAVKCEDDEVVVFAWILWPSREARDAGMEKVTNDPDMQWDPKNAPFDAKRMIYGGFRMIVDV
jgi:uncharacterized protein YbaA (DUF1428 family)